MNQNKEVTKTFWLGRFIKSICSLVFAPFFFVIAYLILYTAEKDRAFITFKLQNTIGDVVDARIATEGNFFIISDTLRTEDLRLRDDRYGVEVDALKLYRRAYTWLWYEVETTKEVTDNLGNVTTETFYDYKQKWFADDWLKHSSTFEEEVNTRKFRYPIGHENPEFPTVDSLILHNNHLTVGGYKLGYDFEKSILDFELLELDENNFSNINEYFFESNEQVRPPYIGRELMRNGWITGGSGYPKTSSFYLGYANPYEHKIGDRRIEYWYIPQDIYTFVAKHHRGTLETISNDSLVLRSPLPYGSAKYDKGLFGLVFEGQVSLKEAFRIAHDDNVNAHVFLRFAGLILMVIAFVILGNPLKLLFIWLPFTGRIWEFIVFKLMQVIGTLVALSISTFYFFKFNTVLHLTMTDSYFLIGVILFLVLCNNLKISVHKGSKKNYVKDF